MRVPYRIPVLLGVYYNPCMKSGHLFYPMRCIMVLVLIKDGCIIFSEGDYLLFASHNTINHIDLNGDNFNIFIGQLSGGAYGLNFHYR